MSDILAQLYVIARSQYLLCSKGESRAAGIVAANRGM